jgi:hypothetical protein
MTNGIGRVGWRTYVSAAPTTASIITTGLVLNLDAGNAASYSGTGTTWTDLSGNGNTGALINGTSYSSANGGTMVFDGINDYANVNGIVTSNSYTISTWCKIDYTNSTYYGRIIEKGLNNEFTLCINKSYLRKYCFQLGGGQNLLESNSLISLIPKYDNVTITIENTSPFNYTGRMYVNGVLENTNAIGAATLNNNNIIYIGGNIQFPDLTSLYGNVANTLMYSRALSASEVLQNFNSTKEKFGYPTYTTRTAAFATATGITDTTILNALNTFDTGLISNGLATKMKALYPFVGGTANTHKYNFMDARDVDAAFRLQFNGGWVHSSTGALPNGTNGYADTYFKPSNSTYTNFGWGFYLTTNSVGVYNEFGFWAPGQVVYGYPNLDGSFYIKYGGNDLDGSGGNTIGFHSYNQSSNQMKRFKNGILTHTFPNVPSNLSLANVSYFIAARNNSGTGGQFSNRSRTFQYISDGLSDSEASTFYTLVQALQTSLSRAV